MVIMTVTITDYYYNTPEYEFSNTNFSNIRMSWLQASVNLHSSGTIIIYTHHSQENYLDP